MMRFLITAPILFVSLMLGALTNTSYADEVIKFEKIMALMKGADIRYEREGHYSDIPFELTKPDDDWEFQNMNNSHWGIIVSAGDNKILIKDFPSGWTIMGTWKFSKDGNRCRIDHTLTDSYGSAPMNMKWKCNE